MDDIYDITKPLPQRPGNAAPRAPLAGATPELTAELLAALAGTSGDLRELEALDAQMARADALRDTATPEGRNAGRVYVAANPLEHIGTAMQRYGGIKSAKRIEDARVPIRKRVGENEKTWGQLATQEDLLGTGTPSLIPR